MLSELAKLPDESMHCCVTSPPYWNLRSYKTEPQIWGGDPNCAHIFEAGRVRHKGGPQGNGGERVGRDVSAQNQSQHFQTGAFCLNCGAWQGELGLEPTINLYVEHIVQVFREVRRVLRKDGTLWLNLGDSYATNGGHSDSDSDDRRGAYNIGCRPDYRPRVRPRRGKDLDPKRGPSAVGQPFHAARSEGLKQKDLCMIPARVALALQADGWYVRCDIIWHKPNPMPESVTDRPTKAHEYIYLLSKSESYFYDAEAIKEPVAGTAHDRGHGINPKAVLHNQTRRDRAHAGQKSLPTEDVNGVRPRGELKLKPWSGLGERRVKQNVSFSQSVRALVATRNKRTVWTVKTAPYKGAHFATFPPKLILPCILAGTSGKGCCAQCGAPYERVIEKGAALEEWKRACGADANGQYNGKNRKSYQEHKAQEPSTVKARILAGMVERKTVGWGPTCECGSAEIIPCTVLDPFGGSGTTGQVSNDHGRNCILIDLQPEYKDLARERLGLFAAKL